MFIIGQSGCQDQREHAFNIPLQDLCQDPEIISDLNWFYYKVSLDMWLENSKSILLHEL